MGWLELLFAQAGEVAQSGGFFGGATVGGTVAGGGVFALFLWYLDRVIRAHREERTEMNAAHAEEKKAIREEATELVAKLLITAEKSVKATVETGNKIEALCDRFDQWFSREEGRRENPRGG